MVTILPSQKNLGSQIGQSLGMGLQKGMQQGLNRRIEEQKQGQIDTQIKNFVESNPNLSPIETFQKLAQIPHAPREALMTMLPKFLQLEEAYRARTEKGNFKQQSLDKQIDPKLREAKERRLALQDMEHRYDNYAKGLNVDLKLAKDPSEKKSLMEKLKNIKAEKQKNIAGMLKGKEPVYKHLIEEPDEFLEEDDPLAEEAAKAKMIMEKEPVQWDPTNPEHIARAKEILQEVGGDRKKANEILAREFLR